MTTPSNAVPESAFQEKAAASAAVAATRPLYWSIRREIWENRSIDLGPLIVAGVFLLGFLVRLHKLPGTVQLAQSMDPEHLRASLDMVYDMAAAIVILTALLVGVFYCLDALFAERRDRSVLFWKSMPVSDITTVLAKASIPLIVLPLYTLMVVLAMQLVMVLLSSMVLMSHGISPSILWEQVKFFPSGLALLYSIICFTLWLAPFYSWLLMVSAWSRRTPILWAFVPPVALCVVEKIALNSTHLANLLEYRLVGWMGQAFLPMLPDGRVPLDPLEPLTPLRFFSTPGLWTGLLVAAGFLAIAVRLRRYREPI